MSVKVWFPVPSKFVALTQTVYVAPWVPEPAEPAGGVPDSSPVDERLMPEGSVDGLQAPLP